MTKFIMGQRNEGKTLALQQHHKELKERVRRASYEMAATNNDAARLCCDKTVEDLLAFELEFGHLLKKRAED